MQDLSGLGVSMADFFEPERQFPTGPFFGVEELVDLTSKVAMSAIGEGGGRMVFRQIGNAREYKMRGNITCRFCMKCMNRVPTPAPPSCSIPPAKEATWSKASWS